jgi:hypothetical protein
MLGGGGMGGDLGVRNWKNKYFDWFLNCAIFKLKCFERRVLRRVLYVF